MPQPARLPPREALDHIAALYAVEHDVRGRPPDERRRERQARAGPLLEAFRQWLDVTGPKLSRRSDLAVAVRYALTRWAALLAEGGYDADRLRPLARDAGAIPVIPGRRNRKRTIRYDKQRYAGRHLIENAFCRLKNFRRVATRYDKLAANFLSGVALPTALAFWL